MALLGLVVGVLAGIGAALIKNAVHFIQHIIEVGLSEFHVNYFAFILPVVGIFISILFMKYIIRKPVGHGIPNVLYSISRNKGYMKPHNTFSSIITSALTVGFGGSVGLEGPTVSTGAAVGSVIGKSLHLSYKQIILMLGMASAGAMSAIFKAPIAGIVFAVEIIMIDLTMSSLIPLLLASLSATLTSYLLLGMDVLYPFEVKTGFVMPDLPYYIGLGIIGGLVAVYFTRMYLLIEKQFEKIKGPVRKVIIGGFALGTLIFLFPALYGEGYAAINTALAGNTTYLFENSIFSSLKGNFTVAIVMLVVMVVLKVVATSLTFGAGGVGGIFAPTLFTGVHLGLVFALVVNQTGFAHIPVENFALIGMGALIAGVLHAPLTAIFLIGDITGGYALLFPLMIVATISYATVRLFTTHSVYTYQLAQRKALITHHKDKSVLSMMNIESLIENNFIAIHPDMKLRHLVEAISKSKRNVFPVIDDHKNFLGVVVMDDIREIIFRPDMYDKVSITELMFMPETVVRLEDSMEEVVEKFRISDNYNLVVLKDGKYQGFVSRANVFSAYRKLVADFSEE